MRLLFLCGGSYVSGMESMALSTMAGLRERGHLIACVVNGWNDGEFIKRLDQISVEHSPAFLGKFSVSLAPQQVAWTLDAAKHLREGRSQLRAAIKRFKPDAIIAYNRDTLLSGRSVIRGVPVLLHAHELSDSTRVSRWVMRRIDSIVSKYVVVSQNIATRLKALGVSANRIAVVHSGITGEPTDHNGAIPNEGALRLGLVGQIIPVKGHADFIKALGVLTRSCTAVRGIIFGRGDENFITDLKRQIQSERLEEIVEWRGHVASKDAIYREMDVCVVPSRYDDPLPLVVLEAGLHGLPVIATRRGGIPEMVQDGVTGYLIEPNDPQALADAAAKLAAMPQRRVEMGIAAQRVVQTSFKESRMIAEVEAVAASVDRANRPVTQRELEKGAQLA